MKSQTIFIRRPKKYPATPGFDTIKIGLNKEIGITELNADHNISLEIESWEEDEYCTYKILLPAHFSIVPGDWRRFVSDREKINEIMSYYIKDNSKWIVFEEISEKTLKELEERLKSALRDLYTIFEVDDVQCESNVEYEIRIIISGDYKDGEKSSFIFIMNVNEF